MSGVWNDSLRNPARCGSRAVANRECTFVVYVMRRTAMLDQHTGLRRGGGRRVEKKVWTWDPNAASWDLTSHRRFVWYNWLLLLELDALDHDGDGQPDNAVMRKYTWGLDLAGLTEPGAPATGASEPGAPATGLP